MGTQTPYRIEYSMFNKRIDEEDIKAYIVRVGIIVPIFIIIALLVGSCEFIGKAFSKPEVRLEFIMRDDAK